jgi:DNA-binding NarL/FixJ family response regulator
MDTELDMNTTSADVLGDLPLVKLVVVDDHPVVCRGVELLVEATTDMTVVGRAHDADAARAVVGSSKPDVALVDLCLEGSLGVDVARSFETASPDTKVIIFTAHSDHEALHQPMPANVRGVVLKDIDDIDLMSIVRQVAEGGDVRDRRMEALSSRRRSSVSLTDREHEVLRFLAAGDSNKEIADALGLAPSTVKTYVRVLMHKLGSRNRLDTVMKAQTENLI